nr:MAG TPA: hypothetical protein [Caudoviricetes sp.]
MSPFRYLKFYIVLCTNLCYNGYRLLCQYTIGGLL